jgi:hypothetical protein
MAKCECTAISSTLATNFHIVGFSVSATSEDTVTLQLAVSFYSHTWAVSGVVFTLN